MVAVTIQGAHMLERIPQMRELGACRYAGDWDAAAMMPQLAEDYNRALEAILALG